MFRSGPLWGLLLAELGHDWGWYTMVEHLRNYIKEMLRFDSRHYTIWTSLPFFFTWVMALTVGCFSDWLVYDRLMDITLARKIFMTICKIRDCGRQNVKKKYYSAVGTSSVLAFCFFCRMRKVEICSMVCRSYECDGILLLLDENQFFGSGPQLRRNRNGNNQRICGFYGYAFTHHGRIVCHPCNKINTSAIPTYNRFVTCRIPWQNGRIYFG
jgi:hypothetical protein